MRLVVLTGSRDWAAVELIHNVLRGADMLIVGDCPTGADAIALAYARANDIMCAPLIADWKKHGSTGQDNAGVRRNQAIVDLASVYRDDGIPVDCHAFPLPSSRGTIDCMNRMKRAGFDVMVHKL